MRTIKFRAWDRDHKKFQHFDFSDLEDMAIFWGNNGAVEYTDFTDMYQQFTGLLDKNGKEIYEGDILEDHGEVSDLGSLYYWENESGIISSDEVIGNIYENPDLL